MSLRILPFRQYNESDVVNLYSNATTNTSVKASDSSSGDAGVFVSVFAGNLDDGPVQYTAQGAGTTEYLGKTDYPFVGADSLPAVVTQVAAALTGDCVLGVTLNQTAQTDENGEKLIYYPQKALELQAVWSGQAVPILTKGIITLAVDAFEGPVTTPLGSVLTIAPHFPGRVSGHASVIAKNASKVPGAPIVGKVIATGNRVNRGQAADQFGGASVGTGVADGAGAYAVVQLT